MPNDLCNRVGLRIATVEDLRAAYDFEDLQSFLDLYYEGMRVLLHERDFFDLATAYLARMAAEAFWSVSSNSPFGVLSNTIPPPDWA